MFRKFIITFLLLFNIPTLCCPDNRLGNNLVIHSSCYCFAKAFPNRHPWSALFYWGKMTNDNLGQVFGGDFTLANDTLYSVELGKELEPNNPFRLFFQPIFSTIDVLVNFTLLDDAVYGSLYEINPYLAFRWQHFPWDRLILTSIAIGEGVSYVSKVPYTEQFNSDEPRKLLNFLLFETTFALPCYPQWEFVARIHHRSGVFGFYHAKNSGSTAVGIGLRYHF